MAENLNQTRLLAILKELAQGHFEQSQAIQALKDAGLSESDINQLIDIKINALVNGAPAALDTLKEIADKLAEDDNATDAILTKLTALQTRVSQLESFEIPDTWLSEIQAKMQTGA